MSKNTSKFDKELNELTVLKDRVDKLIDVYEQRKEVIDKIIEKLMIMKSAITFTRLCILKIYPSNFDQLHEVVTKLKVASEHIEELTKLLGIEKEWKDLITNEKR